MDAGSFCMHTDLHGPTDLPLTQVGAGCAHRAARATDSTPDLPPAALSTGTLGKVALSHAILHASKPAHWPPFPRPQERPGITLMAPLQHPQLDSDGRFRSISLDEWNSFLPGKTNLVAVVQEAESVLTGRSSSAVSLGELVHTQTHTCTHTRTLATPSIDRSPLLSFRPRAPALRCLIPLHGPREQHGPCIKRKLHQHSPQLLLAGWEHFWEAAPSSASAAAAGSAGEEQRSGDMEAGGREGQAGRGGGEEEERNGEKREYGLCP
jgi:hypothetical protein